MRLAQRARSCPACGRREPLDARWCGDCGAPLAARRRAGVVHLVPSDDEESAPTQDRRGLVLLAVLALVGVAVVGQVVDPPVTGEPDLLGRLDDTTGRTSLLPPADDLQLRWRRPVDVALPTTPPALHDLGGHVLIGAEAVDLAGRGAGVTWPAGTVPAPDGRVVLLDGDDVVVADAATGAVVGRAPLDGDGTWVPAGPALGWVAGAALFADRDGVLGAVQTDGHVRWVGDPTWRWDGVGHGTDWAVVTADDGGPVTWLLAVDGRAGTVVREVGPVGSIHGPVVHGDTVVWVDPFAGIDRGLGHPVEVQAVRLDGSGLVWAATDLPRTSGVPQAVRLTPTDDSVVVHYWTVGDATTAVWLDPATGDRVADVTVSGTGVTADGWPVADVAGDTLAHVDPFRREVRVVDRSGVIRWSVPARPGEGVLADGGVVLVRTNNWQSGPFDELPQGTLLQSRLRALDAATGALLWDRVTDDDVRQRFVGSLAGSVGVAPVGTRLSLGAQSWFEPETGRRRVGAGLATRALDRPVADDAVLLGSVGVGARVHPVLLDGDGRLLGPGPAATAPAVAELLAAAPRGAPMAGADDPTVADGDLGVRVGSASVTATGSASWRVTSWTVLRAGRGVLAGDVVVVLTGSGQVWGLDRRDGERRWTLADVRATALTGGGDEVVVGTADGRVLVIDTAGQVLQDVRAGRLAVEDLAVVDGRVLATVGAEVVGLGRGSYYVEPVDRVQVP